jgi:pyridoxal 5'-phosphate synthase pdxS subunit
MLGADGIFVGSGIFKSENPAVFAQKIVQACAFFDDPKVLLEACKGIEGAMKGCSTEELQLSLQERGW